MITLKKKTFRQSIVFVYFYNLLIKIKPMYLWITREFLLFFKMCVLTLEHYAKKKLFGNYNEYRLERFIYKYKVL